MSAYSSAAQWGGACKGVNQSPINLSQSFAKPCDILCDLVFDEGYVSSGVVNITTEGLVLYSQTGLGTCKYNGTGYTCNALVVNHPSHHTIENIQADAEVMALFTNPAGKKLLVSSLVRVNPAQTDASKFLNRFIPYASTRATDVKFGDDWTLSMMVPPKASYYSYPGSLPLGGCEPAQVIVFSSMINIDSNDFALLVKNVPAGSRPVQSLGNREVFFNSGEQLPGGQMPKDGKIYMRLRPKKDDGKKKDYSIDHPDIAGPQKREQDKAGFFGYLSQWARDQTEINGVFSIISALLLFLSFGLAVYCAYKYSDKLELLLGLNNKAAQFGVWLHQKITGGTANYKAASVSSATPSSSSSSSASRVAVVKNPLAEIGKKAGVPMEKAAENVAAQVIPKPLAKVESAVETVTAPVTNVAASATKAAEKAPDNIPVATARPGASSRAMDLGLGAIQSRAGPVNIDKLLPTSSKSVTDKSKEANKGSRSTQGSLTPVQTRRRRNSLAG